MLTSTERGQLKDRDALKPKTRGNLYFRVARKIKHKLEELSEVNEAMCTIPPKNARRVLDDQMVASVLMLAENMIEILGYVPVEPIPGRQPVVRTREKMESKDINSQKYMVEERTATEEDVARQSLLEEHIKALQKFICPVSAQLDGPSAELPYPNAQVYEGGYELRRKWRPDPADRH